VWPEHLQATLDPTNKVVLDDDDTDRRRRLRSRTEPPVELLVTTSDQDAGVACGRRADGDNTIGDRHQSSHPTSIASTVGTLARSSPRWGLLPRLLSAARVTRASTESHHLHAVVPGGAGSSGGHHLSGATVHHRVEPLHVAGGGGGPGLADEAGEVLQRLVAPPHGEHAKVRAVRAGEEGHLADLDRLAITLARRPAR
jgi:hypothetical protein